MVEYFLWIADTKVRMFSRRESILTRAEMISQFMDLKKQACQSLLA